MRVAIIGDGAVGRAIALRLLENINVEKIYLFSGGSYAASRAAGAMLNDFSETEEYIYNNNHAAIYTKLAIQADAKVSWKKVKEKYGFPVQEFGTLVVPGPNDGETAANLEAIKNRLLDGPVYDFTFNEDESVFLKNEHHIPVHKMFNHYDELFSKRENTIEIIKSKVGYISKYNDVINVHCLNSDYICVDKVIIATGAQDLTVYNSKTGKEIKLPNQYYGIGHGMIVENDEYKNKFVKRTPNRTNSCGIHAVPLGDNKFYIGASGKTVERFDLKDQNLYPRLSTLKTLMKLAGKHLDKCLLESKLIDIKTGIRPISEDGLPLVGEVVSNIYMVGGTKRDGLYCSHVFAKEIEKAMFGKTSEVLKTFKPNRKPIEWLTKEQSIAVLSRSLSVKGKTVSEEQVAEMFKEKGLDKGVIPELYSVKLENG